MLREQKRRGGVGSARGGGNDSDSFSLQLSNFRDIRGRRSSKYVSVRYHCGGWPEEVNSCVLNSYMVYL
jgi:hypothetical protein